MSAAAADDSLVFVDAHEPAIEAGRYDVTVTQTVHGGSIAETTYTTKARFHVEGPRTVIQPNWIESRFPPSSSAGDYAGVLPHVAITRSTLPWERDARAVSAPGERRPWLAIALFTIDELGEVNSDASKVDHVVSVKNLVELSAAPAFPGLGTDEHGLQGDDPVRVLDIPRHLVETALPELSWLNYLCHVREHFVASVSLSTKDRAALDDGVLVHDVAQTLRNHGLVVSVGSTVEAEVPGSEWRIDDPESGKRFFIEQPAGNKPAEVTNEARAIVMSCRAALPGKRYRAFLVSLEGRFDTEPDLFDFGGAERDASVRLIVLDSWDFTVQADAGRLEHLLLGLFGTNLQTGMGLNGDRSLDLSVPTAGKTGPGIDVLRAGYALMPHRLRNGGSVQSWFRGPLVSRSTSQGANEAISVHSSDALLSVDGAYGMLDTSLAAAWELGRQLMIADTKTALELVRWKHEMRQGEHRNAVDATHLLAIGDPPSIPSAVSDRMQKLVVLDGVPFGYLVPDPQMLPAESFKAFVVDQSWVSCLVDGAFSVGRMLGVDDSLEDLMCAAVLADAFAPVRQAQGGSADVILSGFVIRSEVISGWPQLHIDVFTKSGSPSPLLRRVRLSDSVLLVIAAGEIGRVELHPNPEALHHGLDYDPARPLAERWKLEARDKDSGTPTATTHDVTMRGADVVDVAAVLAANQNLTPSQFAIRMIAGVPKVTVTF